MVTENDTSEDSSSHERGEESLAAQFIQKARDWLRTLGIYLRNVSITSIDIKDAHTKDVLANKARIEVDAKATCTMADARKRATVIDAEAAAESTRIKADAQLYAEQQRAKGAKAVDKVGSTAQDLAKIAATGYALEKASSSAVVFAGSNNDGTPPMGNMLLGNPRFFPLPQQENQEGALEAQEGKREADGYLPQVALSQ